jgi:hypothetical protein
MEKKIQINSLEEQFADRKKNSSLPSGKIENLKSKVKFRLKDKKVVVDQYFEFLEGKSSSIESNITKVESTEPEEDKEDNESKEPEDNIVLKKERMTQQKSIRAFLVQFNQGRKYPVDMASLYRWLTAFHRGEFEDWNGENDLNNVKCRSKKIIKIIGKSLKRKFPDSAVWNKVAKSKLSPDQYGVFAMKAIPSGTMLGFFKGDYVVSLRALSGRNKFALNDFSHVDGSDFMSCFARYYARSSNKEKQNVSVERLSEWTDSNRAVCFIANKDISAGSELIIATNQEYQQRNKNRHNVSQSQFRKTAAAMAAAFGN